MHLTLEAIGCNVNILPMKRSRGEPRRARESRGPGDPRRASQSPPGASQSPPCIFTAFLCCGRHLVCIFTIYSMLRQVLCMHFYDIFYVAAGTFYAYLRYICDKRARHILSMHIYDILCDNPFFAISMIRCMKMTPPLCCGRRLHAFLRYILRVGVHLYAFFTV